MCALAHARVWPLNSIRNLCLLRLEPFVLFALLASALFDKRASQGLKGVLLLCQ